MAQANVATMSMATTPSSQTAAPSAGDLLEMQEYHRIVRLRDAILAGTHPRIKVPAPLGGKLAGGQQATGSPRASATTTKGPQKAFAADNLQSYRANSQQSAVAVPGVATAPSTAGVSKPSGLSAPQIDPLLLTKSQELIKAEFQLQRQRLERALREELDERAINKSAEQAADFDLSDILAKALTLVQATAPPLTDADMAANASDSSDSFDENTFYSSQHDTPEPSPRPEAHAAAEDARMPDIAPTRLDDRPAGPATAAAPTPEQNLAPSPFLSRATEPHTVPSAERPGNAMPTVGAHGGVLDATNPYASKFYPSYFGESSTTAGQLLGRDALHAQVVSSNGSGSASRSEESGNAASEQRADHNQFQTSHQALPNHHPYGHDQPVIRAHDLSPYAPQPAHVSPLATARQQPIPDPEITILQGAPGPVAALRQEQGFGTSPESSPQGEKSGRKKNKRKNKRKAADAPAADRPLSPYIKPEPRSPSPVTTPQFARPHKRQRPLNRSQHELNYDEARGTQPVQTIHDDYIPRPAREYERVYDPYRPEIRHSVAPSGQRIERPVYEERRPEEAVQYVRRVHSPGYVPQYAPGEARPMRSATYSVADPIYREAPPYHPEGRMSVRPIADHLRSRSPVMVDARQPAMAPPRPPTRIVVDRYGREYIEPPPPPMTRHSVAPAARLAEPEVVYEQAPLRAATRMPGPETFERDGVIYRRASPVSAPRRVVTQPEYGAPDYREYRQRDYSARPVATTAPGQEFVQYRSDGRPPPEVAEFGARPISVRPPEHVRYEYPPPRVSSVRPDIPLREYAASVHPEARREVAPVYREYSVRPAAEPDMHRREFSVRPVERYYDRPVVANDDVQFIEQQPRTVHREIIYEDGRRELYR
ncbi:uncharacterized protein JN550_000874 [Neoarthrinium moseri]|uniref:uncharacterized protein n=1 Tax=Neoarthrinium moseri TaxID=1658444 RepID=UPI001FDB17A4|nr:uncharacterized protein JN550_000874 [Neoarthrinium moseri]KAI1876802.1 hypothetical protein JN550_000874 [Neoarthrinium moseri]